MALLIVLAAVALSTNGRPAAASPAGMSQAVVVAARPTDQIIVRFHAASDPTAMPAAAAVLMVDRLSDAAGVQLTLLRPMSDNAYVFKLPARMPQAEVAAVSRDLAALPEVAHAEPDAFLQAIGNPRCGPRRRGRRPRVRSMPRPTIPTLPTNGTIATRPTPRKGSTCSRPGT